MLSFGLPAWQTSGFSVVLKTNSAEMVEGSPPSHCEPFPWIRAQCPAGAQRKLPAWEGGECIFAGQGRGCLVPSSLWKLRQTAALGRGVVHERRPRAKGRPLAVSVRREAGAGSSACTSRGHGALRSRRSGVLAVNLRAQRACALSSLGQGSLHPETG